MGLTLLEDGDSDINNYIISAH